MVPLPVMEGGTRAGKERNKCTGRRKPQRGGQGKHEIRTRNKN